jgi:hypothetical protein
MFAMVDIVIGLSFAYLVLSLFCTAINEWIASIFALRARTLVYAIDRIVQPDSAEHPVDATAKVLAHPAVKALAVSPKRRPSYIPSDVFATAAREAVSQEGGGDVDWKRRFETTMDRATGWYKREMQILSFAVAAVLTIAVNADSITMARRLWRSPLLRTQFVERARQRVAQAQGKPVAATYANPDEPVPPEPVLGERSAEEYEDQPETGLTDEDRELLEGVLGWGEDFQQFNAALCSQLEAQRDTVCGAPRQETQCETLLTQIGAERRCRLADARLVPTGEWPGREFWSMQLGWALWGHWLGWLMTIAAISVGAPFWFDTLTRFVNLRGTGKRPEDDQKLAIDS